MLKKYLRSITDFTRLYNIQKDNIRDKLITFFSHNYIMNIVLK